MARSGSPFSCVSRRKVILGIGRNDPCPCGSGLKYKRCCMARDTEAATDGIVPFRPASARTSGGGGNVGSVWDVEAVPMHIVIEERGAVRPVVLLVSDGELVLEAGLQGRLRGDAGAVAAALERAIGVAARRSGVWPEEVRVRHQAVADALRPLLRARDVRVSALDPLPDLEEAARAMMEHISGGALWPPVGRARTWTGWDLPGALVADTFRAAAEFWRAAAWRFASNLQAPRVTTPDGREWTACVLGNAGEEFGLSLYSDAADFFERLAATPDHEPFSAVHGQVVALTFGRLADLPAEARQEARTRRWEVAGPSAFPGLITVNTPGGGVTAEQIADLVVALRAVPPFIVEHRRPLEHEERTGKPCRRIEWTHEPTGARLAYAGEAMVASRGTASSERAADTRDLGSSMRAAVDAAIAEAGDDADESEIMAALNRRLAQVGQTWNAAPQNDFGGLSPTQVGRLLERTDWVAGDGVIRLRTDLPLSELANAPVLLNVRTILTCAAESGGLDATATGNLQLAVVEHLLDRLHFEEGYVDELRSVSKRITEMDVGPLHEARVLADVAGLLHRRGPSFKATKRGTDLLDDARAGELYARLFDGCFTRFNLAYGRVLEWPELQHQIGYTLYRLGQIARDWSRIEEMVEPAVLPYARERAPRLEGIDAPAFGLESLVLRRLAGFGLIERQATPSVHNDPDHRLCRVTHLYGEFLRFDL
jgi:SEC-C motif/Domain of unknown function (DUF6930)